MDSIERGALSTSGDTHCQGYSSTLSIMAKDAGVRGNNNCKILGIRVTAQERETCSYFIHISEENSGCFQGKLFFKCL